jgi:hypothetical protein
VTLIAGSETSGITPQQRPSAHDITGEVRRSPRPVMAGLRVSSTDLDVRGIRAHYATVAEPPPRAMSANE